MSNIDDGGLVYPGKRSEKVKRQNSDGTFWENYETVTYPGMTLREWLAGQALAGYCANPNVMSDIVAAMAVAAADAVIAKLKEKP